MDASREAKQAAALASACARARVSHAVWSTLEDTRAFAKPGERMPALGPQGEYCVPHFDEKGAADARFRDAGVPTTFLRTSFFFEAPPLPLRRGGAMRITRLMRILTQNAAHAPQQNFLPGGFGLEPKRAAPGGPLALRLPLGGAKLSGIGVADIGGCAAGVLLDREGTVGKTIGIAGDHLTGEEYASIFSKARTPSKQANACSCAHERRRRTGSDERWT
jgi:uncharacterized protein YbjT (DUF2867 family)